MRLPNSLGRGPVTTMQGLVFNIQRFSVHDGPGIRTLIFMKGCPLHCLWCDNPESQNNFSEIMINEDRCIGCGICQELCANKAIISLEGVKVGIDRQLCNNCGKCAEACPATAIRVCGEYISIPDIVKVLEEDALFYWRSGGGITVGGGEPLCQADFVCQLLRVCQSRGMDTAIETSGYGMSEDFKKICEYANLIFYDIKHMDPGKHLAYTGVTNELILENIRRVSDTFPKTAIIARTPVIPGFNDSPDDIGAIADFLNGVPGVREYELLACHRLGEPKYRQIGRKYSLTNLQPPSQEHMARLRRIAQKITRH